MRILSLQAKAAQLGFGIAANHAFQDGNKRTGAHVMLVFLALNGIELSYTQKVLANSSWVYDSSMASSYRTPKRNWPVLFGQSQMEKWTVPPFFNG